MNGIGLVWRNSRFGHRHFASLNILGRLTPESVVPPYIKKARTPAKPMAGAAMVSVSKAVNLTETFGWHLPSEHGR
jgi:hypothetical protein